jgi:hypothetical protein
MNHSEEFDIRTGTQSELVDITPQVRDVVRKSGVTEGICYLFIPHTTAGLTLNENWDPAVQDDILRAPRATLRRTSRPCWWDSRPPSPSRTPRSRRAPGRASSWPSSMAPATAACWCKFSPHDGAKHSRTVTLGVPVVRMKEHGTDEIQRTTKEINRTEYPRFFWRCPRRLGGEFSIADASVLLRR